jgi:hypothetical protein
VGSIAEDAEEGEEEQLRLRRNPNTAYQPNWRWIVYPRTRDATVDDNPPTEEEEEPSTAYRSIALETVETDQSDQQSEPEAYEVDQQQQDSSFNRSFYEGWYQAPASLTVNNTLLFGGPWGSSHQMNHDDTFDTCDITKIPICNADNNIPGEVRQCFLNSDSITSYAMNLFNVTADNIQVLKLDEKIDQLPFPDAFNVTISQVNHINGCDGNPIVCHSMMTNSSDCDTVYLCHAVKGTTVEEVIVDYNEEVNGVDMYAMCHMNTHNFGREHVAFRMLDKHPGDGVCHFISPNSFLVCKT